MPYYVLPPVLFNTVCAFHESLPASARALFETDFYTRLELMPHPEQSNYDQSPTFDLIPATPGVGHLDAISHWFFLGLLVDGTGGALKAAETADDRAKVLEVARLYLRWLDGDYPSHGEWQAITDEEKNPMPETPTNSYYTAWMLAELGTDNCTFVSSAMSFAATNHYGKKLRRPPHCCVVAPSMVGRLFDRCLNLLARSLGRGPSTPVPDPTHFYWQATWLLDLMNLRWLPTDAAEEELFRDILGGNEDGIPAYLKCLRRNKVEAEVLARTERTLQCLLDWRRRASTPTKRKRTAS